MKCSECGMVGECWFTFFIYLIVIIDEILGVVVVGRVLECAKSGVSVSVIVFDAACWRTAHTFASNFCAQSNVLICLIFGLDK